GKDKPDIYIAAQKALGLNTEDICVFEDSYVALETAKKAGFKTVGIYDKYNYGQDKLEAASVIYVNEGKPLSALNGMIDVVK
ncbi:MAG: HAD-IA family hydrolase, partial [Clostridia bacterium]|nr:HAD-IA family hydrolase [Clostridia bacterium]